MASFNRKIFIVSVIILFGLAAWSVFYYCKTHPKVVFVPRAEVTLTIIPGWNLRQVAGYLVTKGFVSSADEVYKLTGKPATAGSEEGHLAPESVRFYAGESLTNVINKFKSLRDKQITPEMYAAASSSGKDMRQVITMASIVEKEASTPEDMAKVADIFWRRVKMNWALQSCATVNYVTGKNDPAVSAADKAIDSLWNTYKYKGLPPGPISNPGLAAIKATLYPESNDYWYFLSGKDGTMHYAKTLEEHNRNKKYL